MAALSRYGERGSLASMASKGEARGSSKRGSKGEAKGGTKSGTKREPKRTSKGGSKGASERDELVAVAKRLEQMAEEGGPAFDAELARFNEQLQAGCTRSTFKYLYQSMEPEELVDMLLERRADLPAVTAELELDPARLTEFFEARPAGHYDHAAGYDEAQRDLDALAKITELPRDVCSQLVSRFDIPAAERAALVRDYRAPTSVDDLWVTARALAREFIDEVSARGAVSVRLLRHELKLHPHPELQTLLDLCLKGDIRAKAFAKKLGLLDT